VTGCATPQCGGTAVSKGVCRRCYDRAHHIASGRKERRRAEAREQKSWDEAANFDTDPGAPYKPYPQQLLVLETVADGRTLTAAALELGMPRPKVARLLSECYTRLGVKDIPCHHLSQDRRTWALKVARQQGWIK
jgi:DNA-binding NarL/FixJ family response regulator